MQRPLLNLETLNKIQAAHIELPSYRAADLPVKVLQIGEGVFLRAFSTWIIHRLNQAKKFNGSIVVYQPRAGGHARKLNEQDGLFTLILRGQSHGKLVQSCQIISSIREGIDPYSQYDKLMEQARNPDLRFVFSNTTEAGIALSKDDNPASKPSASFPSKMTQVLFERFTHFNADARKGLIFIPCELIENNGLTLKNLIVQTALNWQMGQAFILWINSACIFANTLVDRIVTGYPTEEAESIQAELGYTDNHLDTAEPYHSFVIEAPDFVRKELPLDEVGLNVTWTKDVSPYRERKVRLLNGAHTMTALPAMLAGVETVKECTDDPQVNKFLHQGLMEEILPTIDQPKPELQQFAHDVLERFANPFIKHKLASIALNSVSKFKARLLPAMIKSSKQKGTPPKCVSLTVASLISLYKQDRVIQDDPSAIESIRNARSTRELLADKNLWGEDLTQCAGLLEKVNEHLASIEKHGARSAIAAISEK